MRAGTLAILLLAMAVASCGQEEMAADEDALEAAELNQAAAELDTEQARAEAAIAGEDGDSEGD